MSEKILNTWLPIEQLNREEHLKYQKDTPNMILLWGYDRRDLTKEMRIWTFDTLYEDYDDEVLRYSTLHWELGNFLDVIPTLFMEIEPPK